MPSLHVPDMATYEKLHTQALNNPEKFWGDIAKQFHWYKPWNTVLEWNCPDAKWFSGGTTNACFNAVDRLVANGQGDDVAILWEGEPAGDNGDTPEIRKITFKELQNEVSRVANTLKRMGVRKGVPSGRVAVRVDFRRVRGVPGRLQRPGSGQHGLGVCKAGAQDDL